MVHRNSVDVESFPSKLAERVEEDRGDELCLAELARDHLESGVAPFLDVLAGLLLMNPIFSGEPCNRDVGPLGKMLANPPKTFRRDANWRHVGLRIHAGLSGERAAVLRRPVGPRFPSLRGNASDRGGRAGPHLVERGPGLRFLLREEDARIRRAEPQRPASGIEVRLCDPSSRPPDGMKDSR